jgi:hypothetical protein
LNSSQLNGASRARMSGLTAVAAQKEGPAVGAEPSRVLWSALRGKDKFTHLA